LSFARSTRLARLSPASGQGRRSGGRPGGVMVTKRVESWSPSTPSASWARRRAVQPRGEGRRAPPRPGATPGAPQWRRARGRHARPADERRGHRHRRRAGDGADLGHKPAPRWWPDRRGRECILVVSSGTTGPPQASPTTTGRGPRTRHWCEARLWTWGPDDRSRSPLPVAPSLGLLTSLSRRRRDDGPHSTTGSSLDEILRRIQDEAE